MEIIVSLQLSLYHAMDYDIRLQTDNRISLLTSDRECARHFLQVLQQQNPDLPRVFHR